MAWLTSHSDANKIIDEDRSFYLYTWSFVDGVITKYRALRSVLVYRYVGMTKAAADTCKAAMQGAGYDAVTLRENDADAYTVRVSTDSVGAWSEVT